MAIPSSGVSKGLLVFSLVVVIAAASMVVGAQRGAVSRTVAPPAITRTPMPPRSVTPLRIPTVAVARTLPRLVVATPPEATVGKADTFDVTLISPTGAPMAAERDIAFTITGAGFDTAEAGVLKKGATSVELPFVATAPGLADIALNPAEATVLPYAASFATVLPDDSYTPEPPLSINLRVVPTPPLLYGQGAPKIIAYLSDKAGAPVSAATAVEVAFPEFRELVEPHPLVIEQGAKYGEARIRAAGAGAFRSTPIVTPAAMQGSRVTINPNPMEFSVLGEVASWRPLTDRTVLSGVRMPQVPVAITLVGHTGQPVAADMDRTATLSVDPPDAGYVKPARVTVAKGAREAAVIYTPLREGKGTIRIEQAGLPGQPLEITFGYTLVAFALVAVAGGAAGGIVRRLRENRKKPMDFVKDAFIGLFIGGLVYLVFPLFVSVGFPNLPNASKFIEALMWGVIGGVVGPEIFDAIQKKFRKVRSA